MATSRTELYSGNANTYAIWISITGSNNSIRARTIDTAKTKITLAGNGNHAIRQYGGASNSWLYNSDGGVIDLSIDGSTNNEIGYTGSTLLKVDKKMLIYLNPDLPNQIAEYLYYYQ